MTTLADKIEALAKDVGDPETTARMLRGGSWGFPGTAAFVEEIPTILRALRERDQAVEALKTADAWLDRWARHIGDCPGIDGCTCGLTRVRYEARAALAGDSLHNSKGEEYND